MQKSWVKKIEETVVTLHQQEVSVVKKSKSKSIKQKQTQNQVLKLRKVILGTLTLNLME
jgi:hypothetical protein